MARKIYKECWNYLKEIKIYLAFTALLFVFSGILGFFYPVFFQETIRKLMEQILGKTEGMGFWQLFVFIFENNITTSFAGMIFGIFFGIVPLFFILFNGYVLGFVAGKSAAAAGAGVLLRLFPHGIFELPAIIISLALGLKLGLFIFEKDKRKNRKNFKKRFFYNFENAIKVFLLIVLPLLIIAAFIEAGLIFFLG